MTNEDQEVLNTLFSLDTIRVQAHKILTLAKEDKLTYFAYHPQHLPTTAQLVIDVIKHNYPDLAVPYHSRWRHFEVDGLERIQTLLDSLGPISHEEQGRILYELVIISVFLDAGAGAQWSYVEQETGNTYSRSEGLAIASLDAYKKGLFSANSSEPYRVDAARLIRFNEEDLNQVLHISPNNPLAGVEGRLKLLQQLGTITQENTNYFGVTGRLGDFYTYVSSLAAKQKLSANTLFNVVLKAFNSIWPARLQYAATSLGDVWQHSALKTQQIGSDYVPFHKLSQWLTYSLIEPLESAQINVYDIDKLTGLPEYRNGGLLLDTGLLSLKEAHWAQQAHQPESELIVEWRALTVALLDELAQVIREQLKQTATTMPLAKILQGGTWQAGRQIAQQKRVGGTPPLNIVSDGTVF